MGCQQPREILNGTQIQENRQNNDIDAALRLDKTNLDRIKRILVTGLDNAGKTTLLETMIRFHYGEDAYREEIERARVKNTSIASMTNDRIQCILLKQIVCIIEYYRNENSKNKKRNTLPMAGNEDERSPFDKAMENIVKYSKTSDKINESILDDIKIFWNYPEIQSIFQPFQEFELFEQFELSEQDNLDMQRLQLSETKKILNINSNKSRKIGEIDVPFCLHFLDKYNIQRIVDTNYEPNGKDIFVLQQYEKDIATNNSEHETDLEAKSDLDVDRKRKDLNAPDTYNEKKDLERNSKDEIKAVINKFVKKDEYGSELHFYVYNGCLKRRQKTNVFDKILASHLDVFNGLIYISSLDFLDKYVKYEKSHVNDNNYGIYNYYNSNYHQSDIKVNKFACDLNFFLYASILSKDTRQRTRYNEHPLWNAAKILFLNKSDYLEKLLSNGWTFDETQILCEFDLNNLDFGPSINGRSRNTQFEFGDTRNRDQWEDITHYIKGLFEQCFTCSLKDPGDDRIFVHITQTKDETCVQRVINDCQHIVTHWHLASVPL